MLLYCAILIHVILSWFAASKSAFGEMVSQIVQPILAPFRWARIGMLDLSPFIALLSLDFLGKIGIKALYQIFILT